MSLLLLWPCATPGCEGQASAEVGWCEGCSAELAERSRIESEREDRAWQARVRHDVALTLEVGSDVIAESWMEVDEPDWLTRKLESATPKGAFLWQAGLSRNVEAHSRAVRNSMYRPCARTPAWPAQGRLSPWRRYGGTYAEWSTWGLILRGGPVDPLAFLAACLTLRWYERRRLTGWPENLWPEDFEEEW